jgi:hypothetical protein
VPFARLTWIRAVTANCQLSGLHRCRPPPATPNLDCTRGPSPSLCRLVLLAPLTEAHCRRKKPLVSVPRPKNFTFALTFARCRCTCSLYTRNSPSFPRCDRGTSLGDRTNSIVTLYNNGLLRFYRYHYFCILIFKQKSTLPPMLGNRVTTNGFLRITARFDRLPGL